MEFESPICSDLLSCPDPLDPPNPGRLTLNSLFREYLYQVPKSWGMIRSGPNYVHSYYVRQIDLESIPALTQAISPFSLNTKNRTEYEVFTCSISMTNGSLISYRTLNYRTNYLSLINDTFGSIQNCEIDPITVNKINNKLNPQ